MQSPAASTPGKRVPVSPLTSEDCFKPSPRAILSDVTNLEDAPATSDGVGLGNRQGRLKGGVHDASRIVFTPVLDARYNNNIARQRISLRTIQVDYGQSNLNSYAPQRYRDQQTNYTPQRRLISVSKPTHYLQSVITTTQEEREQALRDYKVTIEYKHLKSHAPGGVYLIPSLQSLRHFFGVIFVRRGPFTNGIFKFELTLPKQYNDANQHPQIQFTSQVYNPYVYADGRLDVKTAYPKWDPSRHYLVTVLTFLKKIFYAKSFEDARANMEAKDLSVNDPAKYRENVDACVRESQRQVFVNADDSTARFTEEELSHQVLRDLLKSNVKDPMQASKNAILSMIEKASRV